MIFTRKHSIIGGYAQLVSFSLTLCNPLAALAQPAPNYPTAPDPGCCGAAESSGPGMAATAWQKPAPINSSSRPRPSSTLPPGQPLKTRIENAQDISELKAVRLLDKPIHSSKSDWGTAQQKANVAAALNQYVEKARANPLERLSVLEDFMEANPESPFLASIALELGTKAKLASDFRTALKALRSAWSAAKDSDSSVQSIILQETALAGLLDILVHLGQRQELTALVSSTALRTPHAASGRALARARAALEFWESRPDAAAQCGINAYNQIAQGMGAPLIHKPLPSYSQPEFEDADSENTALAEHGMSALQLQKRIAFVGADWRWIKRAAGSSTIPTPAVAHMDFGGETGHYTALSASTATQVHVVDTYMDLDRPVDTNVLTRQLSGYFLVPSNAAIASTTWLKPSRNGKQEAEAREMEPKSIRSG